MASPHSKRLRVLSGRHAGACLELGPGEHTIGAAHDNDIAISDWTAPTQVLYVDEHGGVHVQGGGSGLVRADAPGITAGTDLLAGSLRDLQPASFGDIVICMGPADGNWPTDLQLLARLFAPPVKAVSAIKPRPRRAAAYAASGGAAVVVAFCLVAVMVQARPQLEARTLVRGAAASEGLRQALAERGIRGLQVRNDGGVISVDGMVETREQGRIAHGLIAELQATADARPRFAVVEDVAESIRSSVGLPSAVITYLGDGVFSITAQVVDPESARAAISRVAVDLAPAVKRIDVALDQTEVNRKAVSVLSTFSDGDVTVVQTKDGSKYFELSKPDPAASLVPAPARLELAR
jgi:type III secretion protein D